MAGSRTAAPDGRAVGRYRERLRDLRAALDEAKTCADLGQATLRRTEIERVTEQLAEVFRGRARRDGPAETARKAVTKAIRMQLARIDAAHPALGHHLARAVGTGTFCAYAPEEPVEWDVDDGGTAAAAPSPERR
jgi:hypothetical protein